MMASPRIVALVAARNEEATVGATVRALRTLALDEVVVVDDASTDATAASALGAGAAVIRIPRHAGKGAAMEGALRRLPDDADVWLFADADLGASAAGLGALLSACGHGVDLAIAVLPPQEGGGLGSVRRFAAWAIRRLGGGCTTAPLSGQRAITRACLTAARPLAPGFGVETAMTIDVMRAGFRVEEIAVPGLTHRATGRGVRGFVHRGRQGLQIAAAVAVRIRRP